MLIATKIIEASWEDNDFQQPGYTMLTHLTREISHYLDLYLQNTYSWLQLNLQYKTENINST